MSLKTCPFPAALPPWESRPGRRRRRRETTTGSNYKIRRRRAAGGWNFKKQFCSVQLIKEKKKVELNGKKFACIK
jgi:hypothetical protein